MPKIFFENQIINTIPMIPNSMTHYLISGGRKIKKTDCLLIPFEKSNIVYYNNHYYEILHDPIINNNKIYYTISNLLKKNNLSKIKSKNKQLLNKEKFLEEVYSSELRAKVRNEIRELEREIDALKNGEENIKKNIESTSLIEVKKNEYSKIKKFATYINLYNNCLIIKNEIESIDYIMNLFNKINLPCNKILELKNRIYFTKNEKYEIDHIIKNPYEFIQEDWQLFNYDKALHIESEYPEYAINTSDEIRRNAWFYSYIHSINSFYIPIENFELNYRLNTCTIYKNSKIVNIQTLIENNIFILKNKNSKEYITTQFLINYEKSLGDVILSLFHEKNTNFETLLSIDINEYIEEYQNLPGKNILNNHQRNAVKLCLTKKISIITGFPGTGKTTIIDCILFILKKTGLHKNISLCAPTGKAYNNMSKKTRDFGLNSFNCGTLHKVIYTSFPHIVEPDEKIDFLFIDEISMVDIFMFHSVLAYAKKFNFQLILVGDKNQLPSVGPGTILKNMIESGLFSENITTLSEICRQSEGALVDAIKRMANKEIIGYDMFDGNTLNFRPIYPYKKSGDLIQSKLSNFIQDNELDFRNTKYLAYDNETVNMLNTILQNEYNNDSIEITPPYSNLKKHFKLNDRIILKHNETQISNIKNNDETYTEKEQFRANGDEAMIMTYDTSAKTVSLFYEGDGDELTTISIFDLYELYDLSYALTIHKSQGSQYKNIVLFLDKTHNVTKPTLFTAISRAEERCFIFAKDKNEIISIQHKEENNKVSLFLEEFNEYDIMH